jgi:aminoglycoside N3'-acetyltransferase
VSLLTDLRRLGVADGDLLMVHASLRAIGATNRDATSGATSGTTSGADDVLDALQSAIGTTGTLFVNIGSLDVLSEPFDCEVVPADPDNGVLAEVFRRRVGTRVSDHPEGRFAASGPLAPHLLDDVPWNDYYGPGSPLERFAHSGGRILRLGADLDTVTMLHYAEYLVDIPNKRRVRRPRLIRTAAGAEVRVVEALDDSDGIVDHEGDYFREILLAFLESGRATVGRVGHATSELFSAADLCTFAVEWMQAHLTTHR